MGKIRVYQLARELDVGSKELVETLKDLDISVKNHMSTLDEEEANMVKELYDVEDKKEEKIEEEKEEEISSDSAVKIAPPITVGELAKELEVKSSDIITKLMNNGVMATINQSLEKDALEYLKDEFGFALESTGDGEVKEQGLKEDSEIFLPEEDEPVGEPVECPPVITVMGHVDHGKTSVLDKIRKTNVIAKEAGGITQHIGAYRVNYKDNLITFLDTPGHEAFTAMRARGAKVTDIAILVVAADDGVMPQTIEAINHAKAAEVPIIVAINKIDKNNANPDKVKQELTEQGLIPEEWGGDTICVQISAIEEEGLDELLEMIALVAEMNELKAYPEKRGEGTVIEAELDRGRGPVGTLLVRDGTLRVGDPMICGNTHGKIRAMVDDQGNSVKEAGPSIPVEVLGLEEVPNAGDAFKVVNSEKYAKKVSEKKKEKAREKELAKTQKVSLDDLYAQIQKGEVKDLNIVIKADVRGSLEALRQSLLNLNDEMEEVQVNVIHGGVGAISESDIMLANASDAIIIGFNVRPQPNCRKLIEKENVDVRLYTVIYEAIEDIKSAMTGLLEPEYREETLGRIEVREVFKISGVGNVAGSYVLEGIVTNDSKIRLVRDGIVIAEDEIENLKRFKDDAREVKKGYECGILLKNFSDIKEGDILEAYKMKEVPRS